MRQTRASLPLPACIAAAIVAAGLIACSSPTENGSSAQDTIAGTVLRRGNGGEPQTLDPALADDVHAFNVLADLYEGLVVEAADGSLQAGVAERWEVSENGLIYDFFLREDAAWSNGDPVTAADFVYAFRRVVSPGSTAAYSFLLDPLLNHAAVLSGDLPPEELGIRAVDASHLRMELATPTPYFPAILGMPIAFPVHPAASGPADFPDPAHFVGNGPFVLEEWRLGEKIRLKKNPRFRDAASVEVETVDYLPITNPMTELNMYRAGELDITQTVPPALFDQLRSEKSEELRVAPSLGLYYLAFDLSEPPLDSGFLRQALTMAIDRQALVSILGRGERAAFGIVPPGVANHRGSMFAWQDLPDNERISLARELYRQAGFSESSPLRITLTYDVGDVHETVALAVASMWRDVLGVDVALDKKEWGLFLATREDRASWDVMRFSWAGDYNDATTFLDIFRSDSPQNLPGFRRSEFDQSLADAATATSLQARAGALRNAEATLLDDYPVAPLYFFVSKHLVSPRIAGYRDNPLDRHPTRYIRWRAAAPD
jgi:ABC-type oligopeptide transport system substrate-binding subunit